MTKNTTETLCEAFLLTTQIKMLLAERVSKANLDHPGAKQLVDKLLIEISVTDTHLALVSKLIAQDQEAWSQSTTLTGDVHVHPPMQPPPMQSEEQIEALREQYVRAQNTQQVQAEAAIDAAAVRANQGS